MLLNEAVAELTALQQLSVQAARQAIRDEGREPIEVIYGGGEHERVAKDVDIVIVANDVRIIGPHAFSQCRNLKVCILSENVQRIETNAFTWCTLLESISFPGQLEHIGERAFSHCESLECIFLPQSLQVIFGHAFADCDELKFLFLQPNITLGDRIVHNCYNILTDKDIQYHTNFNGIVIFGFHYMLDRVANVQVNDWLIHLYDECPIVKLCADPNVTPTAINALQGVNNNNPAFRAADLYRGVLPLHILTRYNPFACNDTITACYDAYPEALFVADEDGLTPLDNLLHSTRTMGRNRMPVIAYSISALVVSWENAQD